LGIGRRGREEPEGEGRDGRGDEAEGERAGKGEGVLDLDICPGTPRVPRYASISDVNVS